LKAQQIADRLEALLGHEINDWDREELAEKLSRMDDRPRRTILGYIRVIWPVSYALFLAFADRAEQALDCLGEEQFDAWVASVLDVYESRGLHQAALFMDNVEGAFLCKLRGEAGVLFREVEQRLLPYARCALGRRVNLASADKAYSALTTLFLPHKVSVFRSFEQNFLLYKLTVTFLIGLDQLGTFKLNDISLNAGRTARTTGSEITDGKNIPQGHSVQSPLEGDKFRKHPKGHKNRQAAQLSYNPLDTYFQTFPAPKIAQELFYLVEAFRVMAWIAEDYAGLLRDAAEILQRLAIFPMNRSEYSQKTLFIGFLRFMLVHPVHDNWPDFFHLLPEDFPKEILRKPDCKTVQDSLKTMEKLYRQFEKLEGFYKPAEPLPFMGELKCQSAYDGLLKRRQEQKNKFVEALAEVFLQSAENRGGPEKEVEKVIETKREMTAEKGVLLVLEAERHKEGNGESEEDKESAAYLTIGSENIDLPEDAARLAFEIKDDLGAVPDEYVSSAFGRAGRGKLPVVDNASGDVSGNEVRGPIVYDEWDFRRSGFRKNWCRLMEKEITPTKGTFFESTLIKYRGQILHLRKQFEAMVLQENFVRRQRDGNDIDLDAVIEALSDQNAGLAPSERLFVRLQRNERNIAALFLVDMSNSTEGWVGKALKESLILMCESLDVLGDRYAIYGFSGMRRSRSEFFTIKRFTDRYDDAVKGKISAVSPKEYTRMGPAIRHAAKILDGVDAKIRLLITLSDGKPEDYDDYKGLYAIEDTRHALIEAKSSGIHPFCITVDKQSHDYISHMYGEVNYTFIDDVFKLPARIPNIYRNLTS
jgi:nitric oxide reductase NorD protein